MYENKLGRGHGQQVFGSANYLGDHMGDAPVIIVPCAQGAAAGLASSGVRLHPEPHDRRPQPRSRDDAHHRPPVQGGRSARGARHPGRRHHLRPHPRRVPARGAGAKAAAARSRRSPTATPGTPPLTRPTELVVISRRPCCVIDRQFTPGTSTRVRRAGGGYKVCVLVRERRTRGVRRAGRIGARADRAAGASPSVGAAGRRLGGDDGVVGALMLAMVVAVAGGRAPVVGGW